MVNTETIGINNVCVWRSSMTSHYERLPWLGQEIASMTETQLKQFNAWCEHARFKVFVNPNISYPGPVDIDRWIPCLTVDKNKNWRLWRCHSSYRRSASDKELNLIKRVVIRIKYMS